jgi:hypothetical protein
MFKLILILCFINFIFVNSNFIRKLSAPTQSISKYCNYDGDCNVNGDCKMINSTVGVCQCRFSYITTDNDSICNYHQTTELEAFLLSFFLGYLGIDWFILAKGSGLYIGLGVLKFFTGGGCGIWWLVDWIRILCGAFPDGLGQPLASW